VQLADIPPPQLVVVVVAVRGSRDAEITTFRGVYGGPSACPGFKAKIYFNEKRGKTGSPEERVG